MKVPDSWILGSGGLVQKWLTSAEEKLRSDCCSESSSLSWRRNQTKNLNFIFRRWFYPNCSRETKNCEELRLKTSESLNKSIRLSGNSSSCSKAADTRGKRSMKSHSSPPRASPLATCSHLLITSSSSGSASALTQGQRQIHSAQQVWWRGNSDRVKVTESLDSLWAHGAVNLKSLLFI